MLEVVTLYWYEGVDMRSTWRLEGDLGVYHLQDPLVDGERFYPSPGPKRWERIDPDGSSTTDHEISIQCSNTALPSEQPTEQPTQHEQKLRPMTKRP